MNAAKGNLSFTSDIAEAVSSAEVVFICVGTPAKVSGEANLVAVERAVREVARHADDGSGARSEVNRSRGNRDQGPTGDPAQTPREPRAASTS